MGMIADEWITMGSALVCAVLTLVYRVKYKQGTDVFWNSWILIITA